MSCIRGNHSGGSGRRHLTFFVFDGMQTRRKFLRDCSLIAAATLVPGSALAKNYAASIIAPDCPGFEQFFRLVGTPFVVRAGSKSAQLWLVKVKPFSPARPDAKDAGNEKFSLRFRSSEKSPLAQDTYRFEHPRLGRLSIFIVPIGCPDPTQCQYEAIFNRPVNAANFARQISRAPQRVQTS